MDEFKILILNSHQTFFALLCLGFSFFLIQDLKHFKNHIFEKKVCLSFIFSLIGLGTFTVLIQDWWGPQTLFLALELSFLIVVSFIRPKYAIGLLIYLLLSRPWESFENQFMESMPRDVSLLVILSLLGHKILKKEYFFRFNLGTLALLSFSLWLFISGAISNHSDTAIAEFMEIFSKGVILFLLIQNGINDEEDVNPIKLSLVLAILEKCFVSFYKSNIMKVERLESVGILSNSNDIAAIFVLAIPFCLYFLLHTKLRPLSWLSAMIVFICMSALVWQSQSRGAILGLAGCLGALMLTKIRSKWKMVLSIVLALIVGCGTIALMSRSGEDLQGSTTNRVIFWKAGINMAVRNPLFGVGFWGYPENLQSYALGGDIGSEGKEMTAHSTWVLALAEGGFMALFTFLLLWIYAGYAAWRMRRNYPEYFMAVIGYGIAITFLSHTYLLYPYILLALTISHYQIFQTPAKVTA